MRVLILNPNSTESMTVTMVAAARAAVPDIEIEGWTSHNGPPVIEGPEDGARAVPPMLDLVSRAGPDIGGIIIGCFDDTGLAEANRIASCPVIGIGQAAFHVAALRSHRFSVITTLAVSVPVIEHNIYAYGLAGHLGRVRSSGLPVLETGDTSGQGAQRIVSTAREAISHDRCDCIVLGCGGMSHLARDVRRELSVPVIDGTEAAAKLTRAIC